MWCALKRVSHPLSPSFRTAPSWAAARGDQEGAGGTEGERALSLSRIRWAMSRTFLRTFGTTQRKTPKTSARQRLFACRRRARAPPHVPVVRPFSLGLASGMRAMPRTFLRRKMICNRAVRKQSRGACRSSTIRRSGYRRMTAATRAARPAPDRTVR